MSNLSNNYIAGDWVKGSSSISNINPSDTNDVIGDFAQANNSHLDDALNSAQIAQKQWAAVGLEQRQAVLMKIGEETKITQRIGDNPPPCRTDTFACLMQALKALKQGLVLTHFGLIGANFG